MCKKGKQNMNNYVITKKEANEDFIKLNMKLFSGKLPSIKILIQEHEELWGECISDFDVITGDIKSMTIMINTTYPDKKTYHSVLGHEMIHALQYIEGRDGEHNEYFYSFEEKFKENNLDFYDDSF